MSLTIRKKAINLFLVVVLVVILTTLIALYMDVYSYYGLIFAGIALAFIAISLIPFFLSLELFKDYSVDPKKNIRKKYFGLLSYVICLLINLWVVYLHISAAIDINPWPFG